MIATYKVMESTYGPKGLHTRRRVNEALTRIPRTPLHKVLTYLKDAYKGFNDYCS
jgi:hypothetical protein